MKWNVFPNYRIPIEFIFYNEVGERHTETIGWIETPDIQLLKEDHNKHLELIKK